MTFEELKNVIVETLNADCRRPLRWKPAWRMI